MRPTRPSRPRGRPLLLPLGLRGAKLARSLAQASLPDADRARARRYVLDAVAGRKHCNQRELGQLAGAVANNELRAALRAQLHASDHSTARRALHTLRGVRSPGLAAVDVEAAHDLVLVDLRRTTWTPPSVARVRRLALVAGVGSGAPGDRSPSRSGPCGSEAPDRGG